MKPYLNVRIRYGNKNDEMIEARNITVPKKLLFSLIAGIWPKPNIRANKTLIHIRFKPWFLRRKTSTIIKIC